MAKAVVQRKGDYLKEFDQILTNLNKQIEGVKGRTMKGLVLSAAFIRNQTEGSYPKTPVDTGRLRASWFVVAQGYTDTGANPKFKGMSSKKPQVQAVAKRMSLAHEETLQVAKEFTSKNNMVVVCGYSANYAMYVHENIGAVNWKREDSGPKWLETHFKRNRDKIFQIVKDNARIR